jgi:hypothetical protein
LSTKITPSHSDYGDIYDAWVANGRPSQFDREGSFGGAVYRCLNPSQSQPDFYEAFSMGTTKYNEDTGSVTEKGWHTVNEDYLRMRIKVKDTLTKRHIHITRPEYP